MSTMTRLSVAGILVAAGIFPAWAPIRTPKLDDRSFVVLAQGVDSLGTSLRSSASRQTRGADFGPQIEQLRATLARVREDSDRYTEAARASRNDKALKRVERLDDQIRAFENSLGDLARAKDHKTTSRQFTLLSNIMKSMHDTAKSILQNLKA